MKRADTTFVVMRLVDVMAKRAQQQVMLQKRRADARYEMGMPLSISMRIATADDFKSDAKVYGLDISYHGMGFLALTDIAVGTLITISLLPLGLDDVVLIAKVVASKQLVSAIHRIGVEFILDDEPTKAQSSRENASVVNSHA